MNKQEYINWLKKVRNNQEEHSDMWYLVDEIIHESKKLEEPETLSQEWIRENQYYSGAYQIVDGEYYIAVKDLQNLLVPKKMNILEIEAMLDDIGWWDSPTEEQVIVMAIEKGEIGHDGETYKVIKQEKPLYYAKIIGWELSYSTDNTIYWSIVENDFLKPSTQYEAESRGDIELSATKEKWNELGINDTNADFEEVDTNG